MVTSLREGQRSPEFAKALDVLEGWGGALLLAGTVDDAAMQRLLRRMLGDPAEDRYRVLALFDGDDPDEYLPAGVPADRADVSVRRYGTGRSTAVDPGPTGPLGRFDDDPGLLDEVVEDLRSTCGDLARLASERAARSPRRFAPGELRIAVDSLLPLVESAGAERVAERFGEDLFPVLREPRFRARSHWVYYGQPDGQPVETLMDDPGLFDVLVRVRRRQQLVEHQWVLRPDRFPHLTTTLETPWMVAHR